MKLNCKITSAELAHIPTVFDHNMKRSVCSIRNCLGDLTSSLESLFFPFYWERNYPMSLAWDVFKVNFKLKDTYQKQEYFKIKIANSTIVKNLTIMHHVVEISLINFLYFILL